MSTYSLTSMIMIYRQTFKSLLKFLLILVCQFPEELLPGVLPGPAGGLATGAVCLQALRLLWLQGKSILSPLIIH
jgi:hypothetical protein